MEPALRESRGLVLVAIADKADQLYSEHHACPDCGISFPEIEPRMFSFNSPYGAMPGVMRRPWRPKLDVDP